MAKSWKPRPSDAPRVPTTIHEIARRYHACAVALAQTLGLAVAEVLREHRESVTAIFIESSRSDLRLQARIKLPPVTQRHGAGERTDLTSGDHHPTSVPDEGQDHGQTAGPSVAPWEAANGDAPPPTTIPAKAGLPCGGHAIATLKPPQLAMLLGKVATLVHERGGGWVPLLAALQAERARRLATGQRATAHTPG